MTFFWIRINNFDYSKLYEVNSYVTVDTIPYYNKMANKKRRQLYMKVTILYFPHLDCQHLIDILNWSSYSQPASKLPLNVNINSYLPEYTQIS